VAADLCALYLIDSATSALLCAAATGWPDTFATSLQRLPRNGFCQEAIAAGRLIIIEDVQKDTRRDPFLKSCKRAGVRALWMIPLTIAGGEALGCLALYSHTPRRPQAQELEWAQVYARNAALTIDNARLREQASRDRAQLQSVLDQMPEGVLIARAPDGETVLMNRAGLVMAGALPKKLAVADYAQLWTLQYMDGSQIQLSEWPMACALRGESLLNKPYRYALANGGVRYYLINAGPLRRDDGTIFGGIVIFRDITDEQLAADALRESEAKFRHIYENAPVMMHSIDEGGYICNVNRKWLEETGYTRDEVIGRRADFLMVPESAARALTEVLPRFWREGFVRDEPYQYVKKDGTIIDVVVNCDATTDPSGKRISLSVVHNVTEQRRAEKALRATEEKFSKGFAASPLPMSIRRLSDGCFVDVNNSYLRVIKRTREEVIGRTPVELGLWADPAEHDRLMDAIRENQSVRNLELNFSYRPGRNSISLFSADVIELDGEPCMLTVANDITKRKEAEAKLQASEAEMRALFAAMTDVISVLDVEGRCLKIAPTNPAFRFMPNEQVIGKTLHEIFPTVQADFFLDAVRRALTEAQPVNVEYSLIINDAPHWFTARVAGDLRCNDRCHSAD
jgi:PAS domain S-box-containing protein